MRFPLRKIIDFATKNKPHEVDRAYKKFFGILPFDRLKTEWEELFLEWLIFDYKQKTGTSFLLEYILRNPDQLDDKTINQFSQIAKTHIYSMFEIKEIKKGEWFVLEDIHTGETYKVYEKKGTSTIQGPGTIPGRIAKVDDNWYLVGANSVYLPITHTQRAKMHMRNMKIKKYSPKDTVELLMASENKSQEYPPTVTKKQIRNKRKELRKDYEKNVKKYNLSLSFDELIKEIYEEDRVNVLDFWKGLTKKGLNEKFLFEKIQILQDIWNYFPHKYLNNLSPAEVYSKMRREK